MRSHLLSLVSSIERSCPDIFRLTYENKKALTTSIDLSFLLPLSKTIKKAAAHKLSCCLLFIETQEKPFNDTKSFYLDTEYVLMKLLC